MKIRLNPITSCVMSGARSAGAQKLSMSILTEDLVMKFFGLIINF